MDMTPADFYKLVHDSPNQTRERELILFSVNENISMCRKGLYDSAKAGNVFYTYHIVAKDGYMCKVRNGVVKHFMDAGFELLWSSNKVDVIEIALVGNSSKLPLPL
jgi:hypothetical protein